MATALFGPPRLVQLTRKRDFPGGKCSTEYENGVGVGDEVNLGTPTMLTSDSASATHKNHRITEWPGLKRTTVII